MTITLDRPTAPTARPLAVRPADAVTITVSVTLPAGTGDIETALLADELRGHAQRLVAARDGRTTVSVNSPRAFAATGPVGRTSRALPPRSAGAAAVSPLRPRRAGVVSPNSPARRDAEAARRRALQATAVSPASPSLAAEDSLVIDLFGRRVRIDGRDVDLTYKEFELLAQLARGARRIVTREELMETVWADAPAETGERTVDVHVRRLRTKLGRYRRLISTVRGSGYRLDPGSDVAILS
ncbi:winged helix-turn-helix domain-containing protein [Brachybacterium sp. J144]|uniref:winged helix-turn-helix domain-containing protein n=1 Tax=unclassified Brachybacterium TaxID=2623841 RepID=UPI002E79F249|nr:MULTISPECIES: winged helix-turn-helix domain-containing protein [unclassified Brachybacterium]MEE1619535.1 winged helix-turn-helix domain-containing protein [Brachybacterium sp. J153]MEE1650063.1 winged helix-turn-helix domain-containing protein [Brachybacterium sp. J144]